MVVVLDLMGRSLAFLNMELCEYLNIYLQSTHPEAKIYFW